MSLPVAVQVYSVREDAARDLRGTLQKIQEMGYDGVEFAGLYGHAPAEVKSMCEELGLTPISAHVPYVDMMADAHGVLSQYAEIGCAYVAVPYLAPEHRPDADQFPAVIENIAKIAAVAKSLGIQLLYHNHEFEFLKLDGKYALEVLYDSVPAELLQTELDTCWVNVGGEEPAAYVRKFTGRAPVVHLKDFFGGREENMYDLIGLESRAPQRSSGFEFRPLGSGMQDMPAILAAAEDAGARWVVVEQDAPSMGLTPMESIQKSREYLKTLGY